MSTTKEYWNTPKGLKAKEKIRKTLTGRKLPKEHVKNIVLGLRRFNDKKIDASYGVIHNWLRNRFGKPSVCENRTCVGVNQKRFEWALLRGKEYKKLRENFIRLCKSCHKRYDGGWLNLHDGSGKKCKARKCEDAPISKNYCQHHYDKKRRHNKS